MKRPDSEWHEKGYKELFIGSCKIVGKVRTTVLGKHSCFMNYIKSDNIVCMWLYVFANIAALQQNI